MKKAAALLLALAMTGAMLTACGKSAETGTAGSGKTESAEPEGEKESAPEAAQSERTTFTVGFDAEFPPYGYKDDNGEYVGFDLDMARAVCEKEGWEFIPQPIDWDAKDMELSSGAIDCIWNGFTMNGREDAYTWSVPYIDNSQVFVVAADAGVASPQDLAGKAVGVQADSSALAALNDEETPENVELKDSFASLTEYADYNTAFMDLEAGAIDAVALDIGVANFQLSSRGDAFVMLDQALSTEQYGVGFLLGNEDLKNTVEADMLALYQDGTMEKLAEKYDIDVSMICLGK